MPAEPHTTGAVADGIVKLASVPTGWMVASSFLGAITTTQKAAATLIITAVTGITIGVNLGGIRESVLGAAGVASGNVGRIEALEGTTGELRRDFDEHVADGEGLQQFLGTQLTEIQAEVRNLGDLWCERYPEDCESNPRPRRDP